VAASSAGQLSTRYGKIEDMVMALRGVLPDGSTYSTLDAPRSAFGPNLKSLLVGSEGTLGAITAATLRIRPLPESRRFRAFLAPHVQAGTEAIRSLLRRGALPAAVRLYDELDTLIIGSKGSRREQDSSVRRLASAVKQRLPGLVRALEAAILARPRLLRAVERRLDGCLLLLGFEGDPALTEVEERLAVTEAEALGLSDLGSEPAEAWWNHRYSVSFKLSPLIADGFFVDTFEVACSWSELLPLYHAVREGVGKQVAVMAHFSHAYPEGCSIYFSFAGNGGSEAATMKLYDQTWEQALGIARRHRATQSHHHGVGLLKQAGMEVEHGPLLRGFRAFKRAVDPAWIANPGKLGMGLTGEDA
jgi:alkyldihydroxyacetonephosphate synthase